MSKLVEIGRAKQTIALFDTEGAKVTLYKSPTSDQQTEIAKKYEGKEDVESRSLMLRDMIVACFIEWNIGGGADGKELECTAENLGKFSQRDLFAMVQATTGRQLLDDKGNLLSADEIAKKAVSA